MDKPRQKKIQISKKAISIIMLVSVFVFSFIALTYAWYRNYIEIKGSDIVTGKISLEIKGYAVGGNNVTALDGITVDGETEGSVIIESSVTRLDSLNGAYHVYYFIKNPDIEGANHIDASVSVSLDNSLIAEELKEMTVEVSQISVDGMTGSLSDLEGITDDQILAAISSASGGAYTDATPITSLEGAYTRVSIPKGDYACVRVTYRNPDSLNGAADVGLSFRVSFCLANKDDLPESGSYTEYIAYSAEGLRSALMSSVAGDKIIVKSNIDFVGDLVIDKPLTLDIQNSKLNISGNFVCAYADAGRLCIDTSRAGSIAVFKKNVEHNANDGSDASVSTGGCINIDTPFGYVELLGKNSTDTALGDIYAEGDVTVNASITSAGSQYGQGFIVNGATVYPIADERGDTEGFKELKIGARTKVLIMNYTRVGTISSSASVIEIENRGTIEKIDLSEMVFDGAYTGSRPQIYINNYGILTDEAIALPTSGAVKFTQGQSGEYTGNTRIVSQPGAGSMVVSPATDGFISDGSRDPARDHIEYVKLETFIEKINGRNDEVIVQYTRETGLFLPGTSTDIGSSLATLMGYYMGNIEACESANSQNSFYVNGALEIADADRLKYLRISCLSTELSDADYEFIRTMSALVSIDLSDSASASLTVPDGALSGLSNLESVIMSSFDNMWGNNIFTGTRIDEIRLPDSLISVSSEDAFKGIKYIYTAARNVEGVLSSTELRLVFVPDQTTFQSYNTASSYGKVFYDAERYKATTGDYFLRLDTEAKTAELVAFMPSAYPYTQFDISAEASGDAQFDFNTVTVGGVRYTIVKYGTYSFYGKTLINSVGGEVILGDKISTVEPYAFGNASGIETLTIMGETTLESDSFRGLKVKHINITENAYIGNNAFMSSTAIRINAPKVTDTGTNSFREMGLLVSAYLPSLRRTNEPFYGCSNIFRLDIAIFDQNTTFGQNSPNIKYTFIHTYESDVPESYTYTLSYTGIDASNNGSRFLFVPSSFASIYSNYGVKINFGDVSVDNIKEYYDTDDANIIEYTNTYNTSEKVSVTQPSIYYLDNKDGTAGIIKFHKSEPAANTDIFRIPKDDGSGDYYTVTELFAYSYYGTKLTYDTLTFKPSITRVGDYAFYGNGKSIGKLYLNNIERIGRYAFSGNLTAMVYGDNVDFMGNYAFSSNTNLIYAYFPVLRSGEIGTDAGGYYFNGCSSLRHAHVGPLDNGIQSNMFLSCGALRFVTVDAKDRLQGTEVPKNIASGNTAIFLVIGASNHGFPNSRQVEHDFSNILVKGSIEYSKTVNGTEYSISVPEALYRISDGGRTAELLKFCIPTVNMERYVVPVQAIPGEESSEFFGYEIRQCLDSIDENFSGIPIKMFAPNAYAGVSFGDTVFNTGPYVTYISSTTFQGLSVKHLELENVISVGEAAFSNRGLVTVVANKLETVGYTAFQHCTRLESINLPAVKSLGGWTFWDTGLKTVVLGENLTSAGRGGDFADCPHLTSVTLLTDTPAVYKDGRLFYDYVGYPNEYMTTVEENVTLVVKAKYVDDASAYWAGTEFPLKEVVSYESTYTAPDGIEYYYNVLSDNKIELTHFVLPDGYVMGNTFTFPSQITEVFEDFTHTTYTITQLHNNLFYDITEYSGAATVDTIVLPSGIEVLNDNISVMPDTVKNIVIDDSNTVYRTVNGVLYSEDMTTLLYYPAGKTDEEFAVPNTVIAIAYGAFSGNTSIKRITANSKITVVGNAFNGCAALESLTLTSVDACRFIGADIFEGCGSLIAIYVPEGSVEAYKGALMFDFAIRDMVTAIAP